MMTDNPRYQAAKDCAGEAMDALFSVYWADSFQADFLLEYLTQAIFIFTRNARSLDEPHPHPELLEEPSIATLSISAPESGTVTNVQAN